MRISTISVLLIVMVVASFAFADSLEGNWKTVNQRCEFAGDVSPAFDVQTLSTITTFYPDGVMTTYQRSADNLSTITSKANYAISGHTIVANVTETGINGDVRSVSLRNVSGIRHQGDKIILAHKILWLQGPCPVGDLVITTMVRVTPVAGIGDQQITIGR